MTTTMTPQEQRAGLDQAIDELLLQIEAVYPSGAQIISEGLPVYLPNRMRLFDLIELHGYVRPELITKVDHRGKYREKAVFLTAKGLERCQEAKLRAENEPN